MADMVIGDYTAAVTIDGSTHYLLIQPGSASTAYKKINRETLLGVTGQPVDISTVQTLSSKVLDNTTTLTIKDSLFTMQDNSDITKQAQFQLSSITAGQTRTYTLPDASTTLVGTGTTQTLTAKTLTSPTINGGTIDNATVTVDSVAGHTSATSGTIYGITVTTGTIAAAGLASSAVTTAKINDGAVTPAKLTSGTGSTWAWSSWSPTWANLTVGNGTVVAKYIQIGKTVIGKVSVVFGNTTTMGTAPTFTVPVTAAGTGTYPTASLSINVIGKLNMLDSGTAGYSGDITLTSTTVATLVVLGTAGSYLNTANPTSTVPFTWTTDDALVCEFTYEAA